ncbi:hypothetical protein KC19_10G156000 [Ceratodon purpureus]|uniref:Uncharacterized protein n=1 Tax=Ceratodon purpureus TaxID=3225 RepID=A0A8T0GKR9_CERPU|nr:hypothetical protein KC19_10G156000 [Ceratodon purpureus]
MHSPMSRRLGSPFGSLWCCGFRRSPTSGISRPGLSAIKKNGAVFEGGGHSIYSGRFDSIFVVS